MSRKPEPPPLRIGTPCPRQWEEMSGDAKQRYCGECQLHVHNLSAMSRGERERFVSGAKGQERVCVTYDLRPDGSMITHSFWRGLFGPVQRLQFAAVAVLAGLVPFLFSGCATRRTTGKATTLGRVIPQKNYEVTSSTTTTGALVMEEPPRPRLPK